jgi:hypothetical protein
VEDLFFLFLARGEEEDSEATKKKRIPKNVSKLRTFETCGKLEWGIFRLKNQKKKINKNGR